MKRKRALFVLSLLQAFLAFRVVRLLLLTAGGERVQPALSLNEAGRQCLAVIVPVLNEYDRLGPCLEGLLRQGDEVAEIILELAERDGQTRVAVVPAGLHYAQGERWHATLRFGSPLWRADFPSTTHFIQAVEEQVHVLSAVYLTAHPQIQEANQR